ncbi:MAG: hypothetical protein JOY55_09760 [Mycobacterium sp.]|nr:hypothetical protein [Mycobacterium sp.]
MSAERTRSAVAADHRSIIPNIPGVPWWAAVVVAVTGTAAGFAFDAGSGKELTTVFAALYVLGCVVAVLAVRQSGVFTAVIQPPLILFCAVPGAYWLFRGAKFTGLRDLLINCGYPLIERFPLMLFTSGGVLVIGIIRWLLARVTRPTATAEADAASSETQPASLAGRLVSMLAGLRRDSGEDDTAEKAAKPSRRTHAVGRSAKPARSARSADSRRTAKRPAASRSRHIRPPLDEPADAALDRARRSRSQRPARSREFDAPEPPRRGRVPRDPDLRDRPSREIRRDPHARKGHPTRRSSRFDPYEPIEPYEPVAPPELRRRPVPNGTSGATGTHHPISQVRYRGSTRADDSRNEPTARPRRMREPAPDSWNYDIRDIRDA